MTKAFRRELQRVQRDLRRGLDYIDRADVVVAKVGNAATTTLHYVRPDGQTLYSIDKEIGSDLVFLRSALVSIDHLLDEKDQAADGRDS